MTTHKFKIGDRVRIISSVPYRNEGPTFAEEMDSFLGKCCIIKECNSGKFYNAYTVKNDEGKKRYNDMEKFWWDERWLELNEDFLEKELFEI